MEVHVFDASNRLGLTRRTDLRRQSRSVVVLDIGVFAIEQVEAFGDQTQPVAETVTESPIDQRRRATANRYVRASAVKA